MLALLAQAAEDFDSSVDITTTGDTAAAGGILAGLGIFMFVMIIVGILFLVFNIWMLIDCAGRKETDFPNNNKNMWLILLIVGLIFSFGWIVALIYYFSVKKKAAGKGGAAPTQQPPADTAAK